jgi:hypothetical protein
MSVAVTGGPTFADTGTFASTCTFLAGGDESLQMHAPEHAWDFPTSAGVNGAGSKCFGLREQRFEVRAYIVADTAAAVVAAYDTYCGQCKGPVAVSVHGTSLARCFLDAKATVSAHPFSTGLGKYAALATFAFVNRGS